MISENVLEIKKKIAKIVEKQGRDADAITLLGVTKTHPLETIETALQSGIEYIAENKIQEAEQKIPYLKNPYKEFHFIGHLQSNKITKLMPLKPALIHSIDTFSTAKKLNNYCLKHQISQSILIQVNTSGEASKFGIAPESTLDFIQQFKALPQLRIQGLMTIGKFTDDEKEIRTCFQLLKTLFNQVKKENYSFLEMKHLSMGMSNDYEIALEEGSTIVRIGSAIFGQRNYQK